MRTKKRYHFSATQLITLSFVILILLGALLLNTPTASNDGHSIGFLDALFTATSASCVTGLVVVNTLEHWTLFGQLVILALIQFGALGFISIFIASLKLFNRRISLENSIVIQTAYGQNKIGGMGPFIAKTVKITLTCEAIGAAILTLLFHRAQSISWGRAVYEGIFHAISAFCNAGFDVLGADSLLPFGDSWAILLTIGLLIIIGGLGFPVIIELLTKFRQHREWSLRHRLEMLSVHSKIALLMTGILLLLGTVIFLILEWSNDQTLGRLSVSHKVLNSLFQSITLRTAGYYSIDQAGLTELSKLLSAVLMVIGGSPAGTAGGIKTVTIAVVLIAVHSALRGEPKIVGFKRTLPISLLQKALTVMTAFILIALTAIIILNFSEQSSAFNHSLLDLVYEVSSAMGTVGVTTGITPHLSQIGKIVIMLCMFVGRLSPITVIVALGRRLKQKNYCYPEETVVIG